MLHDASSDMTALHPPLSTYERIKAMAITFRLKPGERVNEVELAKTLGVSRTPVREALSRVAAEGFLVALPSRNGYFARSLDPTHLHALYEYRSVVECGVVRLVCERASDAELHALVQFTLDHKDEPETDERALRLLDSDEAFHERLAELSRNDEFVRSVRSLSERLRFARWLDLKARRSETRDDHPAIVRALLARDVVGVQTLMQRHIAHHLDHLIALTRVGYAEIYMGNALADHAEQHRYRTVRDTATAAQSQPLMESE